MKGSLKKDQVQKLVLSGIGFVVLLYVYFSFFLGPLNKGRATAEASMADLQRKLASSKSEMSKAVSLDGQAKTATARFAALKALSPEGAPIAWFPPRLKILFANEHIDKATVRLDGSTPYKEPEMADWNKFSWVIELPQTDFATLGKVLAQLENNEPLLGISRLNIRVSGDDPQFQQVNLSANSTLLK
ncbi:MAG TPA: hypothetical protein VK474_10115 [Chthoniobacterales bacterium]|nr:hypothetical protein [Chthoniobacterales bacterium]